MSEQAYLVIGAHGLVGRAMVERIGALGLPVTAIGRRPPEYSSPARQVQLDLLDRDACARLLPELAGVSHVVYAALFEKSELVAGWSDSGQISTNTAMLRNLLDYLEPIEHLTLLQGTKAYGADLRPMALPGKESAPRHPGENFYWCQEDLVRERSAAANWSFTIMRPQIVCGQALGSPMNIINAIGVYAAVRRHMGAPFSFPGGGGFVTEMTDARLLARAIVWAGGNPRCYGETFNITNGDVVEWESIWPDLASHFDMPVGPAEPQQLSAVMPPLARVWDEVAARHGLQRRTMEQVVGLSWQFADAVFGAAGTGRSTLLSTIKSRQLGFADCIDSARMFCEHFAILEASGMLPRP